ncbi:SDR family oxidoreductase [Pseudorhodoferax soli]|uniref:Short-subunit dehydrogenase n=1 Tax=Pseudorhodoferax soli TaxID=545864 RepID=A0A368Y8J8_9BURK|nr:SDR family oxidoreductase [Pseudorhodoferax soli]RCW76591.1 short-subunit dehydrogenase [Pseudorhodoferax soli]
MATVLVIGASRGIGLEFVRQYREAGARVIATARDDEGLARLKALGATPLRIDVANPASVSGLAWQLDGEKIDIALYVAGAWATADARTPPTREDFDRLMHTNVLGAMQAIPQVAPLVEAQPRGRFAFITSEMGRIAGVDSSYAWIYRASKAALNMAVASAQHDHPQAILVALSPGWVQTDMGGAAAPLTVDQSVAGMRAAFESLGPQHKGAFLDYDGRPFEGW